MIFKHHVGVEIEAIHDIIFAIILIYVSMFPIHIKLCDVEIELK